MDFGSALADLVSERRSSLAVAVVEVRWCGALRSGRGVHILSPEWCRLRFACPCFGLSLLEGWKRGARLT